MSVLKETCLLIVTIFFATQVWAAKKVQQFQTKDGTKVIVESLVDGLKHPWGMAFLPDGRLLVTERNSGKLFILGTDEKLSDPMEGTPKVVTQGQGGLMDVALDPNFKSSKYIYLSYAKPGPDGKSTTALGRGQFADNKITGFKDIFVQQPYIRDSKHFGNRISFSPDGQYLFFALGERFQFAPAQDLSGHLGKVIRIFPDGKVPKDNPFIGQKNARDEIWSYGHRNVEAMDFEPSTGELWLVEMGPKGGDELNKVEKKANYGWPKVSWGNNYDGSKIPDPKPTDPYKDAAIHWTPVISPSGMRFYQGKLFPSWKGDAFVGGLSSKAVIRLDFDGEKPKELERFKLNTRIRDVEEGPDGALYLLTDQGNGQVWRLRPAQ